MEKKATLNRREFIKGSAVSLAALPLLDLNPSVRPAAKNTAKIALIKTTDRRAGIKAALKLFDYPSPAGKKVYIKPNFNTEDIFPGSTHNDTLSQLVQTMHEQEAAKISVGDRSGPTPTPEVLQKKGIHKMAQDLDFEVLDFSKLEEKGWISQDAPGSHWENGFLIARPAMEAEYKVSTCCLKTHQYGGIFTLSLKLSVGLAPRKLMRELHGARENHMRRMIAELNTAFKPQLILLDGMEAFVDGGPMTGTKKTANVILAGSDPVAIDAVGLAVLKELGANKDIMDKKIFAQEQIERAVELKLGIASPDQIELLTSDAAGQEYAHKIKSILAQG